MFALQLCLCSLTVTGCTFLTRIQVRRLCFIKLFLPKLEWTSSPACHILVTSNFVWMFTIVLPLFFLCYFSHYSWVTVPSSSRLATDVRLLFQRHTLLFLTTLHLFPMPTVAAAHWLVANPVSPTSSCQISSVLGVAHSLLPVLTLTQRWRRFSHSLYHVH